MTVSRAQRSTEPQRAFTPDFAGYGKVVRCRPGTVTHSSLERSRISGAPLRLMLRELRNPLCVRFALHRIRDTRG
jgi:hypothetical protein